MIENTQIHPQQPAISDITNHHRYVPITWPLKLLLNWPKLIHKMKMPLGSRTSHVVALSPQRRQSMMSHDIRTSRHVVT